MLAVLQAVLDDFEWVRSASRPPTPRHRKARRDAAAYVESRDRSWPYSFENICEATGLDMDGIRRALRQHAAARSPEA
jgi:ketosteroid isomerase-like protein